MRLPIERGEEPGQESPFAFPCDTVTALTTPQPGVEQVPHGVAEHVEGVDDKRQANPRPEGQPRCLLHISTSIPAEHASPAGNLGRQTISEKAQGGLGNNHPPDVDAELLFRPWNKIL